MTRILFLAFVLTVFATACSDDDCPVCPDNTNNTVPTVTGTWNARVQDNVGLIHQVEWTLTQEDSLVTGIMKFSQSETRVDTLKGEIEDDGYMQLSVTYEHSMGNDRYQVVGNVNRDRNSLYGIYTVMITEMGHTSSVSQPCSAWK